MQPDKLSDAVFEMIQEGYGSGEIGLEHDIQASLKYTLEKVNLHQYIIDTAEKVIFSHTNLVLFLLYSNTNIAVGPKADALVPQKASRNQTLSGHCPSSKNRA